MASPILFAFAVLFISVVTSERCTYENCPKYKKDMLNVHLVCHSHDDAGWLKTVDQYFWGANQSITKDGVQYVLNTVLPELLHDPSKRFSYAESGFFWRWWNIQDDLTRHQMDKLVSNGQLEFVGGGWVQNDEAAAHYAAIIDQMTIGHRFLNETFGRCGIPKVAWQIDPFGHSRESASLFAQMGLDALFFARIHYLDRAKRLKEKSMEMMWRGSDDLGADSDILTSVFYEHYMPPDGFCFDEGCDDEPIMDDTRIEGYNVHLKVADFIAKVKQQASNYSTNHIMLTMGGDFQYMNADRWFTNLDKLIHYVNNEQTKGSKVNVFYSTPACYAQALFNSGVKFPSKTDDFFPYANDVHSYWTGYFTSRPALKGLIRNTNNLMQVCQALDSIAQLDPIDWGDVDVLHRSLGLLQHHDAVTGTAKQHVTNDYAKQVYVGIEECQQVANDAMKYLTPKKTNEVPPYHSLCTLINTTVCNVTQTSDQFVVTVHNGLSKEMRSFAKLPVNGQSYSVIDPDGLKIDAQVIKTFITQQMPYIDRAPFELIFPIEIPALGFATYYVSKTRNNDVVNVERKAPKLLFSGPDLVKLEDDDNVLQNNIVTVTFDRSSGLMTSISERTTKTSLKVRQNFFYYVGVDNRTKDNQPSGAYIFRPNDTTPLPVCTGCSVKITKIGKNGDHLQEMRQTFAPWLTQIVRLYEGKPYVEFEWTVGPIPFADNVSREIISRFDTDVNNGGVFFTDSNGRQMMMRKLKRQPTYQYNDSEPVSGNYYPVNTRIFIKDNSKQVTILTDRSQGGSSLQNGQMELMVHRRLLQDDNFGVNEPLNETGEDGRGLVVSGKHWLLLSTANVAARKHRVFGLEMFYQPVPTFAPMTDSFDNYRKKFKTLFSGLTQPLPLNINTLTVAQWQGTSMVLRFEHLFQKGEDHELSVPVTVDLKDMFTTYDVVSVDESTLSMGAFLVNNRSANDFTVTVKPMEIRTFRVNVQNKLRRKSNNVRERFNYNKV